MDWIGNGGCSLTTKDISLKKFGGVVIIIPLILIIHGNFSNWKLSRDRIEEGNRISECFIWSEFNKVSLGFVKHGKREIQTDLLTRSLLATDGHLLRKNVRVSCICMIAPLSRFHPFFLRRWTRSFVEFSYK